MTNISESECSTPTTTTTNTTTSTTTSSSSSGGGGGTITSPISKPNDSENRYVCVRDLISHQRLITIKDDQTLEKALILMLKYNIRHLPVVDHTNTDKLVGIITERDLRLAAASPVIDPDLDLKEMMRILSEHKVSEVMQPVLYTVTEDESILAACKIMRLSKRGSLPILQKDTEKLMGIITQTDLLDHLIRVLEPLNSQP